MLAILRGDPGEKERGPLLARIVEHFPTRNEPRIRRAATVTLDYASSKWDEEARELLQQQIPLVKGEEGDRLVTTYAERWYAENGEKFFAEGEAKGEAKGKVKGKAETLMKLLRLRFGDLPKEVGTRIAQASIAELDVWAERVLTAETLDEVFKD